MSVLLGSEVSELAWERAKLPTCFGGLGIRVAQMGFAAQATYWSAVDLHKAVMSNICEALNRPIRVMHPEIAAALAAKTDLLLSGSLLMSMQRSRLRTRLASCTRQALGRRTSERWKLVARPLYRQQTGSQNIERFACDQHDHVSFAKAWMPMSKGTDLLATGVAVDEYARVKVENEASRVYEASPWAADKRAAEIVRPAPVQAADSVPPKSLARDMAFAKLQSKILSAAEAVQAARLHSEMLPEQQAIMLSAGGPGTGKSWTAMHKSPTELPQNAQWRMATALRLGATPDAGR